MRLCVTKFGFVENLKNFLDYLHIYTLFIIKYYIILLNIIIFNNYIDFEIDKNSLKNY